MTNTHHEERLSAYEDCLGEMKRCFEGTPSVFTRDDGTQVTLPQVHIYGFKRNFSVKKNRKDRGWVLVTSGMSDCPMNLDQEALDALEEGEVTRRVELIWYVREPTDVHIDHLRWLAQFPFMDATWLGFGHTVPLPHPVFPGSKLSTSLLLGSIIRHEQTMLDDLRIDGDEIGLFVVHLLTPDEYALKREQGVDAILDLFDEGPYPLILDEARGSLLDREG